MKNQNFKLNFQKLSLRKNLHFQLLKNQQK